jgi:hypothetical protein
MRQAIDHHIVTTRLMDLERLDGDSIGRQPDGALGRGDLQIQPLQDLLKADRPTQIGSQRQANATDQILRHG